MKSSHFNGSPLEIESLLTADERRVSIAEHAQFRESISLPAFDQFEDAVGSFQPVQRRSEKQTSKLEALLDDLEIERLRSQAFEEAAAEGWSE